MHTVIQCRDVAGSFGGPYLYDSGSDECSGMINAGIILNTIVNKHLIYGQQPLTGRGYLRDPSISNISVSPMAIQKASNLIKKAKDSMDNEIRQFLKTGEVTLGFKDDALYSRVEELERHLNETLVKQEEYVAMKERIVALEVFVNHHTDNMLALENILNTLIEKTNIPRVDVATEYDDIIENTEDIQEDDDKKEDLEKMDEVIEDDNPVEFFFLLAALLMLVTIIFYMMYKDNTRMLNQRFLDNCPAFGTKLLM